jgi:hypothetical protein
VRGAVGIFHDVSKSILSNWDKLTCHDIWHIYTEFVSGAKRITGSAAGYTGLSEFLVAQVLEEIGGNLKRR